MITMPRKPKLKDLKKVGDVFYYQDYPVAQECQACMSIVGIDPCSEENLKTVSDPKCGRVLVLDCPTCKVEEKRRLKGKTTWTWRWTRWRLGLSEQPEVDLSKKHNREIYSLIIHLGPLKLHSFTDGPSI